MLNVGSGNSPFSISKFVRRVAALAFLLNVENQAAAAPAQIFLDPDSATTIVTRDSDFTYRMTDGVQFICDLYFPPYLPPYLAPPLSSPCDIQAGVITPPVYIRSIASDGSNRYGGGINVSMFSSKYNGRILSTTFTVSLSAPATGYIGYADQFGTNFHNFITVPLDLAPGTQQLTFTAPPGMSLHSMYMGYLDGEVNAPQISLRDISLRIEELIPSIAPLGAVPIGQQVALDGTGSVSTADLSLTYSWQITSGPGTYTLSNAQSAVASFIPDAEGTYVAKLTITDTIGNNKSIKASIIASPAQILVDTGNSPVCPASSTINMTAASVGESIPLVGVPFSINYSSDRFQASSHFMPQTIGLGGWTPSILHSYKTGVLYLGDGGIRNVQATAAPGGVYTTDASASQVFTFDPLGRHRQTLHALTGAAIYTFNYGPTGKIASIVDAFGNTTSFQYTAGAVIITAPFGQKTFLALDTNGFLATTTNPNNETYTTTHTALGRLLGFRKPMGQLSQKTYDANGFLLEDLGAGGNFTSLLRSYDGASQTQTVVASSALGRKTTYMTRSSDPNNSTLSVLASDGSDSQNVFQAQGENSSQDSFGAASSSLQAQDPRFGWLAPYSSHSNYALPAAGINQTVEVVKTAQLTQQNDPRSFTSLNTTTTLQGDRVFMSQYTTSNRTLSSVSAMGRTSSQTINSFGQPVSLNVGSLDTVNMAYDPRGHLASVTQGSRQLSFLYDASGNLAVSKDASGNTTSYVYNEAGRVVRQILPSNQEIATTYDANGNITSITPPGKTAHTFGYNLFELVENYVPTSVGSALSGATTYTYNLDKQIAAVNRPDGTAITYQYAAESNQLTEIDTASGRYSFTYVPNSSLVQSLVSPDHEQSNFQYLGNRVGNIQNSGPVSSTMTYSYLADGSIGSIGINGDSQSLSYDKDGLLIGAGDMTFGRNGEGAITSAVLAKIKSTMQYNSLGEMTALSVKGPKNSPLFSESFEHDNLGRIVRTSGNVNRSYGYDSLGQLVSVSGDHRAEYQYDSNGNRIAATIDGKKSAATFDAQDRLLTYGRHAYEYTTNGERSAKTEEIEDHDDEKGFLDRLKDMVHHKVATTSYVYNSFGDLKAVTLPSGKRIEYILDGQNRRVGKLVNGNLVQGFVYQSQTQIAAELDARGGVVKRFIYGSKANVPDFVIMNGKKYLIVSDQVGTPQKVVDSASGKVVAEMDFDEFGVMKDSEQGDGEEKEGGDDTEKLKQLPFGFAGGIMDRDTGLVHFGAREYEPETGRWLQKDPSGFMGRSTNLYGYSINDPVNFMDPTGRIGIPGAILGAISGAVSAYITSGGSFSSAALGAVIGAAVGFATPGIELLLGRVAAQAISQALAPAITSFLASFAAQYAIGQPINYGVAIGAGLGVLTLSGPTAGIVYNSIDQILLAISEGLFSAAGECTGGAAATSGTNKN